jgi:hypothetical protein
MREAPPAALASAKAVYSGYTYTLERFATILEAICTCMHVCGKVAA